MAWAFLGQLSLVAFLFDYNHRRKSAVQGIRIARAALKINPLSQHGHITLAMAHIFLITNRQVSMNLEHTMILNPNAVGFMGIFGCLMIAAGEYDRGIDLIENSMNGTNPIRYCLNLFISLYHFKQKEYTLAFPGSDEMDMPDLVSIIFYGVATLSHMGRKRSRYPDKIIKESFFK